MSNSDKAAKAVYAQPKLAVYGGFSQLTAAGSGASRETSSMGSMTDRIRF